MLGFPRLSCSESTPPFTKGYPLLNTRQQAVSVMLMADTGQQASETGNYPQPETRTSASTDINPLWIALDSPVENREIEEGQRLAPAMPQVAHA